MAKLKMALMAALMASTVLAVGAGGAAAQQNDGTDESAVSQLPDSDQALALKVTNLRRGLWLEWNRTTAQRVTHIEIRYWNSSTPSERKMQVEKPNATHGFIPYDELTPGATYGFRVRAKKRDTVVQRGPAGYEHEVPASGERSDFKPGPARPQTHPSDLTVSREGDVLTFEWTAGVSDSYKDQGVRCKNAGRKAFHIRLLSLDARPNVVKRVSTTYEIRDERGPLRFPGERVFRYVLESNDESGLGPQYVPVEDERVNTNQYICRVFATMNWDANGPMSNQVKFNKKRILLGEAQ